MDVVFWALGKVVIDDVFDMGDIEAASNDVGSDEDSAFFFAEVVDDASALILFKVAVDGFGVKVLFIEFKSELVCAAFCFNEYEDGALA